MTRWILSGALCALILVSLGWAVREMSVPPAGLASEAFARLPESGVSNPVTAVLLNYRGYDTLLEVAVLLVALVGLWSLARGTWPARPGVSWPLLGSLLRLVLPGVVLGAAYVLWIGAFAPGGAFQGGALLGGGLVLAMLGGRGSRILRRTSMLAWSLALGVMAFVGAAGVSLGWTGGLLRYPDGQAGAWILVIESAAMVSIGWTLGLLYLGGRLTDDGDSDPVEGGEGRA